MFDKPCCFFGCQSEVSYCTYTKHIATLFLRTLKCSFFILWQMLASPPHAAWCTGLLDLLCCPLVSWALGMKLTYLWRSFMNLCTIVSLHHAPVKGRKRYTHTHFVHHRWREVLSDVLLLVSISVVERVQFLLHPPRGNRSFSSAISADLFPLCLIPGSFVF